MLNFIDTPGHVDFHYEVQKALQACEGAILVVDATQGVQAQTVANAYAAIEVGLEIIPVINKIDLPSARPVEVAEEIEQVLGFAAEDAILVSAKTGQGIDELIAHALRKAAAAAGRPRRPDPGADLRQHLRRLSRRDRLRPRRRRRTGQGPENPADGDGQGVSDHRPRQADAAAQAGREDRNRRGRFPRGGDQGPARCSHRRHRDRRPAIPPPEPLPGYKPIQQMVYCDFYPGGKTQYDELRDAMDRLQLNDSSFSFAPESSDALGFGFRCGFLGLLHMEIIQERLEREFNIEVVQTAPTVTYEIKMTDGTIKRIDAPSELPNPTQVEEIREPYIQMNLILPGRQRRAR